MRSILVVSDLTHASDGVIRAAAVLAGSTGAELHVVHAQGLVGLPLREAVERLCPSSWQRAAEALGEQLSRTLPAHVQAASAELDRQAPYAAVLRRAREVEADLLLVGPECVWPADARSSGPMPRRLAAASATPVLVVRGLAALPRRVLAPVSPGDLQGRTLEKACAWLHRVRTGGPGAPPGIGDLYVLHVSPGLAEWRETAPDLDREVRAVESPAWTSGVRVHRCVRWGSAPGERIVETASYEGADLVVLGPGGGATSAWVTDRAPCSVLLLPGERDGPDPAAPAGGALPREDARPPALVAAGRG